MTEGMKVCRKCLFEKPITEFPITDRERGYRKALCKECESARVRAYYASNPAYRERIKARNAQWVVENPEAAKTHRRTGMLRGKYDLSREQYAQLVELQGNRCALCGTDQPGRVGKNGKWAAGHWNIDHSHADGHVRGLLCHTCNVALGMYEMTLRDKIGMGKVLEYLERPSPVLPTPIVVPPEYVRHERAPDRVYKASPPCTVDGCDEISTAQGLCQKHYMRLLRNGEVGPAEHLPRGTARGASHPKSKLTEDDVRAIRASTEKGIRLAERYGVTATLISNIRQGKVWTHLH